MFKYFAKFTKLTTQNIFWQKTNNPIELYSPAVIDQKMDYVHNNSVTTSIVTDARYYYCSRANPISSLVGDEHWWKLLYSIADATARRFTK